MYFFINNLEGRRERIIMENLGQKLKVCRMANNVSLKKLAREIGINFVSLSYFESRSLNHHPLKYEKYFDTLKKIKGGAFLDIFSWKEKADKWDKWEEFQKSK
jgi:transcriptional regulator with XRE-family HTH domain